MLRSHLVVVITSAAKDSSVIVSGKILLKCSVRHFGGLVLSVPRSVALICSRVDPLPNFEYCVRLQTLRFTLTSISELLCVHNNIVEYLVYV